MALSSLGAGTKEMDLCECKDVSEPAMADVANLRWCLRRAEDDLRTIKKRSAARAF
jgi:hypothetical protein